MVENESNSLTAEQREARMLAELFITESLELMETLEPLLLRLEEAPSDLANVASIFRVVHTIKGASGVTGNAQLTRFLHRYEDVLAKIKSGVLVATPAIISAMLEAFDTLDKTLAAMRQGGGVLPDLIVATAAISIDEKTQQEPLLETRQPANEPATARQTSDKHEKVSVPTQALDELMHLIGETTVIRNMVNKIVASIRRRHLGDVDIELLAELLDEMHKINGSMQVKTAEIRKTPLAKVIAKLPRVVRDVSIHLGKKARLVVSGDDIRVDTTIAQALNNCMVHMIRNSLDHGIESPEKRSERGKPVEGTIFLRCREDKDHVVVEIGDDGGGIDPERVRAKLKQNGQMDPSEVEAMGQERLFRQIFEPGFSTASVVSDISGRGVGLDMVRSCIEGLKGKIEICSELGKGATFKFTIPIPRSVAIINALVVGVAGRWFAIPQDNVVRLLHLNVLRRPRSLDDQGGALILRLDGMLLPLVDLRQVLGIADDVPNMNDPGDRDVVVVKWDGGSFGLIVEAIEGAEDIVVKPLHACVERLGVFSAATFLGDGTVGLIIDVAGVARATGQLDKGDIRQPGDDPEASNNLPAPERELLLFEMPAAGYFAFPLGEVQRLEELPGDSLMRLGSRWCIKYAGEVIPVLDLLPAIGIESRFEISSYRGGKINALILSHDDRLYAAPVSHVRDVIRAAGDLHHLPVESPAIAGIAVIDQQVVTVLNVAAIVRLCGFSLAPKQNDTGLQSSAVSHPEAATEELAGAAGWGLF